MVHEWQEMRLADCMDAIIDYRGKTPKKTESGIPLITAKIIKNGRIEPVSEFIAEDDYDSWMRRGMPLPGDIVMTTEAPLGEIAQLDNRKIALAQRVITLRGKRGLLDNTFLKYLMISNYVQHQLDGRGTGTTVKGIKQSELREVLLKFPPFSVQKKIANILGSLDEKIETNRQTNQTLEAMAQALFKSWFVDFDPVIDNALAAGHEIPPELQARAEARKSLQARAEQRQASLSGDRSEQESGDILPESIRQLFPNRFVLDAQMGWIPEGWEITQIKDVAGVVKGKSYKSAELAESKTALVTLKSFNRGGGYRLDGLKEYTGSYKPEQEVFAGDLVIAYTDVTQAADVIGKPAMVVSDSRYEHLVVSLDVAVVRPKLDSLKYFLYGLAQTRQFQDHTHSHSTGTTVLHLSKDAVPDYCFALPDGEVLRIYERMVKQNFESIDLNISSLRTLEKLRDTLLPKLISGELRLPDEQQPAKTVTA